MCIHSGDRDSTPTKSVKAVAKERLVTSKQYVKELTNQLRQATKDMGKRQREYVNA